MRRKIQRRSLIRELDKINFWGCKNIRMGTALCTILTSRKDWNQEKYNYLKGCLNHRGKYKIQFNETSKAVPCFVLSSYNIRRADQTEMFERLTDLFDEKHIIKAVINKNIFYDEKKYLLVLWFLQMYGLRIPVLHKKIILLYMYIYYSEATYIFSEIENRKKDIKVIAVFDDIFPIDNIVVQLCKKIGLKTSTFHHAIINGSYKYVEYKYSVADYFLAWGNYTRDIAIHYGMSRNKIKVLGPINKIGEEKKIIKSTDEKVFGVMTRGTIGNDYVDENIDLIHIANTFAQKYGYKYTLRFHPSDKHVKDYMAYVDKSIYISGNKKDTLLEFLGKVEFSICANSSAYAEAIYYRKMCYRYISKREEKIDVCKGIDFGKVSNLEQLELRYNEYRTDRDIDRKMERVSEYIFKNNVEHNYIDFFKKLKID